MVVSWIPYLHEVWLGGSVGACLDQLPKSMHQAIAHTYTVLGLCRQLPNT